MNQLAVSVKTLCESLGNRRESVSIALGYFPAWKAWDLKETHGFPLADCAAECAKLGLKMDWRGIEHEAAKRGADIRSEIEEAKRDAI